MFDVIFSSLQIQQTEKAQNFNTMMGLAWKFLSFLKPENSKLMEVYQQNPKYTECLLDMRFVYLLIGLFCHYLWLYGLNVGLAEFWVRILSETFTKFSPGLNNLPNIYMLKFTNQEKTLNNFIPIAWKVYPIQMKINVLNFEKIRIIMSDYFFLVENFPLLYW